MSAPARLRIAAIEVSHWHALHDSAYLRHVVAMPDALLVGTPYSGAFTVSVRFDDRTVTFTMNAGERRRVARDGTVTPLP